MWNQNNGMSAWAEKCTWAHTWVNYMVKFGSGIYLAQTEIGFVLQVPVCCELFDAAAVLFKCNYDQIFTPCNFRHFIEYTVFKYLF